MRTPGFVQAAFCFGGNNSAPAAPVSTPAVPVDQITAGNPTVTVAPNPANNPAPAASQAPSANQQSGPSSGLNM